MIAPGDNEGTESTRPLGTPWQQPPVGGQPAPTWQWTGTAPVSGTAPMSGSATNPTPGFAGTEPAGSLPWWTSAASSSATHPYPSYPASRSKLPRRIRLLGAAAALLLVGGVAGGGAAFEYAHTSDASSAAGIAGGSSGSLGESPNQLPQRPGTGNGGSGTDGSGRRGDGHASRFSTPGHASAAQSLGVVDIYTKLKYQGARAAGTGMVLTSDGEVLTNNHVIEGSTKIKVVVVSTGKKYVAKVVGTDKVDDVALLQLRNASGLHTITPDSDTVTVGQPVTAVGNAMGVGGVPSAAEGTVIGLGRSITTQSEAGVDGERLTGLIETDAQVVSGDSGGPLYDAENEVIGMDTAASSSPLESRGYAIPIAKALAIAHQMASGQESGNISLGLPAFLGVQFSSSAFGGSGDGAVVGAVLRNTPAERAGLSSGDTIISVDGATITSGDQLQTILSHYEPGQSATVTWNTPSGGSSTATVTLMAGPAE